MCGKVPLCHFHPVEYPRRCNSAPRQDHSYVPGSAQVQLNRVHSSAFQQSVQPSMVKPASVTINHGAMNLGNNFYLKVLCPEKKRSIKRLLCEVYHQKKIDTPTKLKEAITVQCDGLQTLKIWKLVTTPIQQSYGSTVAWILMMFGTMLVGERN